MKENGPSVPEHTLTNLPCLTVTKRSGCLFLQDYTGMTSSATANYFWQQSFELRAAMPFSVTGSSCTALSSAVKAR